MGLTVSCSKQIEPLDPEPFWIQRLPPNPDFYYGVGGPASTIKEARESARAELARSIEVQIESEIVRQVEGRNENINRVFIDRSRSYATKRLPDVELEQYQGKKGNYALARIRRSVIQQLLSEAAEQAQLEVKGYQENGDNALRAGNIITALRHYHQALDVARTLPLDYNRLGQGLRTTQIERQIDEIRDNLQLHIISGDNQSGTYGYPLAEPVVVQVKVNQIPIPNFLLKAKFINGPGGRPSQ